MGTAARRRHVHSLDWAPYGKCIHDRVADSHSLADAEMSPAVGERERVRPRAEDERPK